MKIIGITGPIGSGKSHISSMFNAKGIPSIDTDKVYHELVSKRTPTTDALALEFGASVLNCDGSLNRPELAKIVFSDPQKLSKLNEISHEFVRVRTLELIESFKCSGFNAIVLEVPLMFESGFDKLCDTVICVAADEDIRVKRIMLRNGFSEEDAKKRVKNQKDIDFYIEKSEKVLYNNDEESAKRNFELIYAEIFGK